MKSFVRWAGSKKALLPELKTFWSDDYARYIEPFCGSACLFFELEPKSAILGDINSEIITTYHALRFEPSKVAECLVRYRKSKATYYAVRRQSPATLSEVEVAARFLFLNRLCFNGIYRTNRKGEFNVPYAKPKHPVVFDIDALMEASTLLRRVELINADFENILDEASPDDFVYMDPPYAVASRRVFSEYHPDSFSKHDLARFSAALARLDKRGVRFVVSYADSAEGRQLSSPWNHRRVRTRRNVAGFAGDRRHAFELLASNLELN